MSQRRKRNLSKEIAERALGNFRTGQNVREARPMDTVLSDHVGRVVTLYFRADAALGADGQMAKLSGLLLPHPGGEAGAFAVFGEQAGSAFCVEFDASTVFQCVTQMPVKAVRKLAEDSEVKRQALKEALIRELQGATDDEHRNGIILVAARTGFDLTTDIQTSNLIVDK